MGLVDIEDHPYEELVSAAASLDTNAIHNEKRNAAGSGGRLEVSEIDSGSSLWDRRGTALDGLRRPVQDNPNLFTTIGCVVGGSERSVCARAVSRVAGRVGSCLSGVDNMISSRTVSGRVLNAMSVSLEWHIKCHMTAPSHVQLQLDSKSEPLRVPDEDALFHGGFDQVRPNVTLRTWALRSKLELLGSGVGHSEPTKSASRVIPGDRRS